MGVARDTVRRGTAIAAAHRQQAGVMLIEVLIAILIFSIGVLAVVGMQVSAINNVTDAKYRSEAAFLTNRLISQLWTDVPNIGTYAYTGSGGPPASLSNWITDSKIGVNTLLPNATLVPPIISITNQTAGGAQVTIQLRWCMNEDAARTPPCPTPHNYFVVASIYTK